VLVFFTSIPHRPCASCFLRQSYVVYLTILDKGLTDLVIPVCDYIPVYIYTSTLY